MTRSSAISPAVHHRAAIEISPCASGRWIGGCRTGWAGPRSAPHPQQRSSCSPSAARSPSCRWGSSSIAVPVGAAVGWLYARVDLASDAAKARLQFRHALSAYLELVTILIAGGAGVETAMFDAAAVGQGSAFRHIRTALSAAQAQRQPPWQLLGQLGDRLGVDELSELHASMTLAGDGAQVRETLGAKASGIRMRDLAELESEAQARSETMVLPVVLMFAGFLVLIGYPALAALSTP